MHTKISVKISLKNTLDIKIRLHLHWNPCKWEKCQFPKAHWNNVWQNKLWNSHPSKPGTPPQGLFSNGFYQVTFPKFFFFIKRKNMKRWKKMAAAAAQRVLIFHSCANFYFFHAFYQRFLAFFVQFLLIGYSQKFSLRKHVSFTQSQRIPRDQSFPQSYITKLIFSQERCKKKDLQLEYKSKPFHLLCLI